MRYSRPTANGHAPELVAPLLRWVGGKQRLAKVICQTIPRDFRARVYVEPFFGAGSVFFHARPSRAILADANEDLIEMYKYVRSHHTLVARHLRSFATKITENRYYKFRSQYNSRSWSAAQAARFILLNRTCYNGVFRVNMRGEYNVPYGRKERPLIPTTLHLRQVARALANVRLKAQCFRTTLARIPKRSFVYLDPPYPPLNGTAYFTHYTLERFSLDDQRNLADCVYDLDGRSIPFVLSNADIPEIRSLYQGFHISTLPVTRYVSCKGTKLALNELLISNLPRKK